MAVNKVIYNGETLVDLTNDTVAAANTLAGIKGHSASGKAFTGTIPSVAGGTITPGTEEQVAVTAGSYVTGDIVVAAVSGGLTVVEFTPTSITQSIEVPWPKDTLPKHTIVWATDNTVDSYTTLPKSVYHTLYTKHSEGVTTGRVSGVCRKRPSSSSTYYTYHAIGPNSSSTAWSAYDYYLSDEGTLVMGLAYAYYIPRKYYVIGVYVD